MKLCGWMQLVVLVLLLAVGSAGAVGWHAARVELKDGTVYEDCGMGIDDTYKTIELKCGETTKRVSFTKVAKIVDKLGNDITGDVIGEYYQPSPAKDAPPPQAAGDSQVQSEGTAPEAAAEAVKEPPVQSKPYGVALYGRVGWTFPIGDYFEGISSGPGGGVDMSIVVNRHYAVRLSGRYNQCNADPTDIVGGTEISNNLKMKITRFMVGLEYFDWPNWRAGGKTKWNMYTSVGITTTSFSGEAIIYDPFLDGYYALVPGKSVSKFTQTLGMGGHQMLSPSFGLYGDLGFDLLYLGTDGSGAMSYALTFDFQVGVAFVLR